MSSLAWQSHNLSGVSEIHHINTCDHTLKVGKTLYRDLREIIQITSPGQEVRVRLVYSRAIGDKITQRVEDINKDKRRADTALDYINFPLDEVGRFERDWKNNFVAQVENYNPEKNTMEKTLISDRKKC